MNRRPQFGLRSLFSIVFLAAIVAWVARESGELALILAGAIVAALLPRRFPGALCGGLLGACAVALLIGSFGMHWAGPSNGINYPKWKEARRMAGVDQRFAVLLGTFSGAIVGIAKEARRTREPR